MAKSDNIQAESTLHSPELLAAEIERLARAADFINAEKLRTHLLETHPLALKQIIDAAEIIEQQKAENLDHNHLNIWQELYSGLELEEKNCLFYSTKVVSAPENSLLLKQGKRNSRLFFIDSGRLTMFHTKDDDRVLLGQLSRGDVLGVNSFFDISMPNLSAGCQTSVQLRYLEKRATADWHEQFPGLYQKLAVYCRAHDKPQDVLLAKKYEKRRYQRKAAAGRVTAHILNSAGQVTDKYFRGSAQDISRVGLSFETRLSKAKIAEALLDRSISLKLELDSASQMDPLQGRIVKAGFMMHSDYTIHVEFDSTLAEGAIRGLPGKAKS